MQIQWKSKYLVLTLALTKFLLLQFFYLLYVHSKPKQHSLRIVSYPNKIDIFSSLQKGYKFGADQRLIKHFWCGSNLNL